MTTKHTPGRKSMEAFALMREELQRVRSLNSELLEALERAEKQLAIAYNPSESPIVELCRCEAQQSCNQARAAIAKARGEA